MKSPRGFREYAVVGAIDRLLSSFLLTERRAGVLPTGTVPVGEGQVMRIPTIIAESRYQKLMIPVKSRALGDCRFL